MPYKFFCDETGTDKKSEWVGVAGYIASLDQWAEFRKEWQNELNKANLPFFHFSDLAKMLDKRHEIEPLVARCADIASRNTILGIGVFVNKNAYEKIMPQWYKNHVKLPEVMCWQDFLHIAFGESEEKAYLEGGNVPVSFVFDHVDPKSNREWYCAVGETYSELKLKNNGLGLIGTLSFESKSENTPFAQPLQGVDCLAYRIRQVFSYSQNLRPKQMDEAIGRNIRMTYYDSDSLEGLVRIVERDKIKILAI
jgi:hypothetical protein